MVKMEKKSSFHQMLSKISQFSLKFHELFDFLSNNAILSSSFFLLGMIITFSCRQNCIKLQVAWKVHQIFCKFCNYFPDHVNTIFDGVFSQICSKAGEYSKILLCWDRVCINHCKSITRTPLWKVYLFQNSVDNTYIFSLIQI